MIKLDKSIYDDIKEEYFETIFEKIIENTQKNKHEIKKGSNNIFFNQISLDELFKTNNNYDKDKIKKIIFMDFTDLKSNNKNLRNYFLTACLIHYSRFKVTNELNKAGIANNKEERIKFRNKYVKKFDNPWIKKYIEEYDEFDKTDAKFKLFIDAIKTEFNKLNVEINNVINYSLIEPEMRHDIITSSGITVCPYCDRQYISYFEGDNYQHTTADLDHFYPKSVFLLFSLSLYNFIPSCQICNQRFKKDKSLEILYPFQHGFEDDAKFIFDIDNIDGLYGKADSYHLRLNINNESQLKQLITNNKEMFHLENLYQHHKGYIKELLIKHELIYNEAYLSLMADTFKDLNLSEEELKIFLYGYDFENQTRDKTLGKLTKDIIDFLDDN